MGELRGGDAGGHLVERREYVSTERTGESNGGGSTPHVWPSLLPMVGECPIGDHPHDIYYHYPLYITSLQSVHYHAV